MMDIEVCIESLEEADLAIKMSARRVELCSALEVGGLTPSGGLIEECCRKDIEVHVLIRPRPGDFVYNEAELNVMKKDIESAAQSGAAGVVFGMLTSDGDLDVEANQVLLRNSHSLNLEATFHRAFDLTSQPFYVMNQLVESGFTRILTSGQKEKAIMGIDLIRKLVKESNGQIQIMAGSGVSNENAKELADAGIDALHFSSRKKLHSEKLGMGNLFEPDVDKISAIMRSLGR